VATVLQGHIGKPISAVQNKLGTQTKTAPDRARREKRDTNARSPEAVSLSQAVSSIDKGKCSAEATIANARGLRTGHVTIIPNSTRGRVPDRSTDAIGRLERLQMPRSPHHASSLTGYMQQGAQRAVTIDRTPRQATPSHSSFGTKPVSLAQAPSSASVQDRVSSWAMQQI
jgi:hypothetical protein